MVLRANPEFDPVEVETEEKKVNDSLSQLPREFSSAPSVESITQ
jgi:hypothetical protein